MHHTHQVIGNAMCIYKRRNVFVELSLKILLDVVPHDLHVVVAVRSGLLVKDPETVHHLVLYCARIYTARPQVHVSKTLVTIG